jgi:hypothetical protein
MRRHTKNIQKALFLLAIASVTVLGCELVVDFDRTKIPVDQTEAGPLDSSVVDTGTEVDSPTPPTPPTPRMPPTKPTRRTPTDARTTTRSDEVLRDHVDVRRQRDRRVREARVDARELLLVVAELELGELERARRRDDDDAVARTDDALAA